MCELVFKIIKSASGESCFCYADSTNCKDTTPMDIEAQEFFSQFGRPHTKSAHSMSSDYLIHKHDMDGNRINYRRDND